MEMWGLPANRRVNGRNMKGLKIDYLVIRVSRKGWGWKIPSGRETVYVCVVPACLSVTVDKKCPGMAQNTLWVSSECLFICVKLFIPLHLQQPGEEGAGTITTTCSALGHLNMFLPEIFVA